MLLVFVFVHDFHCATHNMFDVSVLASNTVNTDRVSFIGVNEPGYQSSMDGLRQKFLCLRS